MTATTRTPEKELAFLSVLADTCNVSKACKAIGEARTTVYQWRAACPDFAARWDEARAIGADALEDEVVRRAHEGVAEPVFYKGFATGETIQKYSDTLAIFLLKGFKPDKYKDRVQSEVSGPGGAPIELDDKGAADKLAAILNAAKQRHAQGEDLA